jgi:choline-sulfatase
MPHTPNILFIMADQMTPFLTGAYGHPVVQTPHLDRLVAAGVRFDSAYSPCPVCGPARAALMTGKYVSAIGTYDNAALFPADEPTFAHYLSAAGYDTVASGKLHFIGPDQLHGFDRRLTTDIFPTGFNWIIDRVEGEKPTRLSPNPIAIDYATAGVRQWSMQLEFDEEVHHKALEYIRSRRTQVGGSLQRPVAERDDRPFLLFVSYTHPHEPFHVTRDLWDLYEGAEIELPRLPKNLGDTYSAMDRWLNARHGTDLAGLYDPQNMRHLRRAYYGLVSYVDRKVGELLKALEDCGLRENTVVVFCSDHGDMLCEKGMIQKRSFYEWSSRVPLVVRFPDGCYGGKRVTHHVSLIDIAPTLLDIAGIAPAERLPCDGTSLMGLIDGTDDQERIVLSEMHSEGVYATCFMVREGRHKYVRIGDRETQLFDMEDDPGEWNDLSSDPAFPSIRAAMERRLLDQFDPARIERDVDESIRRRKLVKRGMIANGTSWDYTPYMDVTRQYWRD